jgi:hypothetical protein
MHDASTVSNLAGVRRAGIMAESRRAPVEFIRRVRPA